MKSNLGLELLTQIDAKNIDFGACVNCLRSTHLFDQAIGFTVLTEPHLRELISDFREHADVPALLLEHLLNCIVADISRTECEEKHDGYLYDKGGAFLDLRVPLDRYWKSHSCEMTEERFFERIAAFLVKHSGEYFDPLPTHLLEAWPPKTKPFSNIMRSWKADPLLGRYVADLEVILNHTF